MSGKHSHGAGVQRAIFRRMWEVLIALIVAETLRAIFNRKELMDCGGKEFVDPGRVDSFLDWAIRQEKLSKPNGSSTYRANVSPIHYLPAKVQPYLQDKGLLDVAMKLLARIANPTTKILGVGDVELAFSTIHDDIELTTKQALIILAHLVDIGVLQDVGENQYLIVQQGGGPAEAHEDREGVVEEEPVAEASSGDGEIEQEEPVEPFVAQPEPPAVVPLQTSEQVTLSPTGHVSATNRMRMLQLFAKTRGRIFKADAKERARDLGYVSGPAFTMALGSLHKAGWIRPEGNRRGWWRWNIENVPLEWREAYGYATSPARPTVSEAGAVEVDDEIPSVVVAEEAAVQVPTADPMPSQATTGDVPEEAPTPQPDLAEQLAQAHRQLEEQEGVNDLLTKTVVEMMYGYMRYMSKDLQLRILGGLAVKIKG